MRFTMRSRLSRSLEGLNISSFVVGAVRPSRCWLMILADDQRRTTNDERPTTSLTFPQRSSLDPPLIHFALEYPFYVNAGSMHHVGIEFSDFDQVLHFSNRDFRSSCHHGIEISCRLAIDQISPGITLPGFHEGKGRSQRV